MAKPRDPNRATDSGDSGPSIRREPPSRKGDGHAMPAALQGELDLVLDRARHLRRLPSGGGLTALFSGPSGTGKTLAARALARELDAELQVIDLSQVVSKWIGETEKHIDEIFERALARRFILFFDEADALFGKRTAVQDAHDRFDSLASGYLLKHLGEHSGIAILASHRRQAFDQAFLRRVDYVVEFPFPDR